ncbi:MBL fold metallo-hydrolase [Halorubrum trueperi]
MEDIELLPVPTPFAIGDVNCYVIHNDGLTLVDPGPATEEAYDTVKRGLERLNADIEDVQQILITHPHPDHFGAVSRLKQESGAKTAIHMGAVDIVENFLSHYHREQDFFLPFLVRRGVPDEIAESITKLPESFVHLAPSTQIDESLSPGAEIHAGGIDLQCIDCPGHSQGSLSFYAADESIVFTGDHILANTTPNPVLQAPDNGDRPHSLELYLDSLEALLSLDAEIGYGGHGPIIDDLPKRIHETINHHQERKERFFSMVKSNPKSAYELTKEAFPDLPATELFMGLSEVIGHIDLLISESRVAVTEQNGVLKYEPVDTSCS